MTKEKHYMVGKYVFETEPEAHCFRMEIFKKTGTLVAVEETEKKATHKYEMEERK